jgi:hypothetical protein
MDQNVSVSLVFPRSGQQLHVNIPCHLLQATSRGTFEIVNGRLELQGAILHRSANDTSDQQ